MTDQEIEERLQEALAVLKEQVKDDGDDSDLPLDLLPTIEGVEFAVGTLQTHAVLIRQAAERLELHARHLDERLEPIQADEIRAFVRHDPEGAAKILYFVSVLGDPTMNTAYSIAHTVESVVDDVRSFDELRLGLRAEAQRGD